jgi:hypothetical protein
MKYETPQLVELIPAIDAIATTPSQKTDGQADGAENNEGITAYEDYE